MIKNVSCLILVFALLLFSTIIIPSIAISSLQADYHYQPANDSGLVFSAYSLSDSYSEASYFSTSVLVDVSDPDGVSHVSVAFIFENQESWSNFPMEKTNHPDNMTYSGRVQGVLDPGYNDLTIQFHANDTLGHLSSSQIFNETIFYNEGDDPPYPWFGVTLFFSGISLIVCVVIGIGWWYRKRH